MLGDFVSRLQRWMQRPTPLKAAWDCQNHVTCELAAAGSAAAAAAAAVRHSMLLLLLLLLFLGLDSQGPNPPRLPQKSPKPNLSAELWKVAPGQHQQRPHNAQGQADCSMLPADGILNA
jgi:hypothetical protein